MSRSVIGLDLQMIELGSAPSYQPLTKAKGGGRTTMLTSERLSHEPLCARTRHIWGVGPVGHRFNGCKRKVDGSSLCNQRERLFWPAVSCNEPIGLIKRDTLAAYSFGGVHCEHHLQTETLSGSYHAVSHHANVF